jgi:hypothetical protein
MEKLCFVIDSFGTALIGLKGVKLERDNTLFSYILYLISA